LKPNFEIESGKTEIESIAGTNALIRALS